MIIKKGRSQHYKRNFKKMYLMFPQVVYFSLISASLKHPNVIPLLRRSLLLENKFHEGKDYCILKVNPAPETADTLLDGWMSEIHNLVQDFGFTRLVSKAAPLHSSSAPHEEKVNLTSTFGQFMGAYWQLDTWKNRGGKNQGKEVSGWEWWGGDEWSLAFRKCFHLLQRRWGGQEFKEEDEQDQVMMPRRPLRKENLHTSQCRRNLHCDHFLY